jgi:prepilin peptidase CpaA
MELGLKLMLPVLLLSASILDLLYSKIPNILNYPFMAGGVLHHAYMRGMEGLIFSLEGLGLGIILLLFFYLAGGMGAGDVKLMGAIGSLLGPAGVLKAFLISAIIGGCYAILLIVIYGKSREYMDKFVLSFKYFCYMRKAGVAPPQETGAVPRMRYGVAVAIGTALSVFVF